MVIRDSITAAMLPSNVTKSFTVIDRWRIIYPSHTVDTCGVRHSRLRCETNTFRQT